MKEGLKSGINYEKEYPKLVIELHKKEEKIKMLEWCLFKIKETEEKNRRERK